MMKPEMEKSLLRVVSLAGSHAKQFRLMEPNTGEIPKEAMLKIASDMVDLFEREIKSWNSSVSPNTTTPKAASEARKSKPSGRY